MNNHSGKFIVIDGTDGSGKTTQLKLLKESLEENGYQVEIADFPQYNTKSAGPIEEYLSGKYGEANEVGPYKASMFYAIDRYDASFRIQKWLNEDKVVLANRYTSANMGHQGCKIDNPLERGVFFKWLYDLEYKMLAIPEPDTTIILHVKSDIAQNLVKQRAREDWQGKTNDIHENNLKYLEQAEQTYLEIANSFPNFFLIECSPGNNILSREEIHQRVWSQVEKLLTNTNSQANTSDRLGFNAIGDIINNNHPSMSNNDQLTEEEEEEEEERPTELRLIVERIEKTAKLPQKAHTDDAGYDLYANDYYSIPPYGQTLVSTGIKMIVPEHHVALIWDKSGLANEGITTMGGVIDSNYRGEIRVIIKNLSEEVFNIIPGQKIAQVLIQTVLNLPLSEEKITNKTERQAKGFGSSGKF